MPTGSTFYELAGATGPADLLPCMVRVLKQVDLDEDIYTLGLRGTIDAALRPDLAEKILKARHTLHEHLQDGTYAGLVEPFPRITTTRTCRSPKTCCSARRSASSSTATTSRPIPT